MRGQKRRAGSEAIAAMLLALLQCAIAAAQDPAPISSLEVKLRKQIFKNERFLPIYWRFPPVRPP